MITRTITYTDFNDEERTETLYFNLSQRELARLENSHKGGLTEWIRRAVEAKDGKTIMDVFEEIIHAAYGVKSPDGKTFIKTEELYQEFIGTNAYDKLFMELVTDADKASEFIIGCMPKDLQLEARKKAKELEANGGNITAVSKE